MLQNPDIRFTLTLTMLNSRLPGNPTEHRFNGVKAFYQNLSSRPQKQGDLE